MFYVFYYIVNKYIYSIVYVIYCILYIDYRHLFLNFTIFKIIPTLITKW